MRQSHAILAALAGSVSGQNVVSYFFPGGVDNNVAVATIKVANPSTTEFILACPTGTDSTECGFGSGSDFSIISGTRYQATLTAEGLSVSYGCDYNAKVTVMTCTADQTGGGSDIPAGPQTAVLTGSDVVFNTATVVEGASLLTGGAASATASPSSGSASMASQSMASSTGSAAASKTSSGQASASSTAAAVRFGVEGAALLALAGAAVHAL